jgi:hypothetical protein
MTTTTTTTCRNCGAGITPKPVGRPSAYCSSPCRSRHRADVKAAERLVDRLNEELAEAEQMLAAGRNLRWSEPAVAHRRGMVIRAEEDLALLRLGVRQHPDGPRAAGGASC